VITLAHFNPGNYVVDNMSHVYRETCCYIVMGKKKRANHAAS